MSHVASHTLKVGEIALKIGLSVRQLQRLAKSGKMLGVILKADGYHNRYTDCPELRQFIKERKAFRKGRLPGGRKKKKNHRKPSVATQLRKASAQLMYWYDRSKGQLHGLKTSDLEAIEEHLQVWFSAHAHIERILMARKTGNAV